MPPLTASRRQRTPLLTDFRRIAAAFPGQAILLANVSNAFTLQGSAMIDKGNFYAAMFIVLAAGCFISYFALGYATNLVSQVRAMMVHRRRNWPTKRKWKMKAQST